jgi:phycobilisome rod-core linker protein
VPLPLLEYKPVTQNQRVEGYEIPGDEQVNYSMDTMSSQSDVDAVIAAAYRQIFFYAFESDRERFLESQLRFGQITVRDFIRGLLLSDTFYNNFFIKNSNYRIVEQCAQRILGRDVYGEQEKIAWSIVIATKGFKGFVDALLDSPEYMENFGDNKVPSQRRRTLPSRSIGEVPFNLKSPFYDEYYRKKLGFPQFIWRAEVKRFRPQEQQVKAGDPTAYLSMARSINPRGVTPQKISVFNINYEASVPKRR